MDEGRRQAGMCIREAKMALLQGRVDAVFERIEEAKVALFVAPPRHAIEPLTEAEITSLLVALERSTEMSGTSTLDRDEKSAAEKLLRAFDPGDDAGLTLIRMDTDPKRSA